MKWRWWRWIAQSVFAVSILTYGTMTQTSALAIPPAPTLERPIVDQANILSIQDIDRLSAKINASRAKKDYQIGVLIVPTLGSDEYLEGYALKVARAWGIGSKDEDNGVLVLVAVNDRKVRIEVGRRLEGDLTDLESGRIVRTLIAPEFRKKQYATGLSLALDSIAAQVEGVADPHQATVDSPVSDFDPTLLLYMGFWIFPWLGAMLARSRSWWAGGLIGGGLGFGVAGLLGWATWALIGAAILTLLGLLFDYIVSKNYRSRTVRGLDPSWWAGGTYWGGHGGDSGGFGGFGGGDFGGGGASGDW